MELAGRYSTSERISTTSGTTSSFFNRILIKIQMERGEMLLILTFYSQEVIKSSIFQTDLVF